LELQVESGHVLWNVPRGTTFCQALHKECRTWRNRCYAPAMAKTAFARWLIEQRKAARLSTEELAAQVGVSDATLRGSEAGRMPSLGNATSVARALRSEPPARPQSDDPLIEAVREQTQAINDLVGEIREDRERGQDAAAAMLRVAEALLGTQRPPADATSKEPAAPRGSRQ
jgi:transcriptional regulator with XRE-family HTH domain